MDAVLFAELVASPRACMAPSPASGQTVDDVEVSAIVLQISGASLCSKFIGLGFLQRQPTERCNMAIRIAARLRVEIYHGQ